MYIVPGGFRASQKRSPDTQEKDSSVLYLYYRYCSLGNIYSLARSSRIPFVLGSIPTGPGDFRRLGKRTRNCFWRLDSTHFRFRRITYIRTDTTVYEDGSYVLYIMYIRSRFMYRKRVHVYTVYTVQYS